MTNKFSCFFLFLLAQTFLLSVLVFNPAFAQKSTTHLRKYRVEILSLEKQTQKKYQLKLIHPYSFRLRTIQKSLVSLKFKKKDLFNIQEGRIFNNDLVKRLAPLIQNKFTQVNSSQRVSFKISDVSGKVYTQGDTFLTSEGLHWRFTTLRGVKWGIEDFSVSGEPWVLVLRKGQAYKQRYWRGSKKVVQDIISWVIFENVLPVASQKLPEPAPKLSDQKDKKSSTKSITSDIKKRLNLLKQLRKESVISEEEYRSKRQKIIGQL